MQKVSQLTGSESREKFYLIERLWDDGLRGWIGKQECRST